ncbi:hypothetical protein ASD04_02280 [Devosia sp. Root436]|uniref:GIY-YIG nuclease family protein n=1 Tax=Devosia sp. Root436 TaxID=1736537 RepID=UPI0006FD33E4|nr:GIY-YIG nuclease family protein [Devosia sp. Root436]KQX42811.1 hypothetical protein ASD04_02280 [Devosia sp. Root436]
MRAPSHHGQPQARRDLDSSTDRYDCDKLVWYEVHEDVEAAILREKRIKDWKRPWKDRLIEAMNLDWRDLSKDLGF